jgi:hypothetical protein
MLVNLCGHRKRFDVLKGANNPLLMPLYQFNKGA